METEGFIWKTKGPIFPIFLVPTGMLSVNIAKHPVDVNEKKKKQNTVVITGKMSQITSFDMQLTHPLHSRRP